MEEQFPKLFDYVDSILTNKKNLVVDKETENKYSPFMINRALSNHVDCILYAQEMNLHNHIDKKLQNDYLINSIRPAKRFAKWPKKKEDGDIDNIRNYYGYNYRNAKVAASILSKEQIKIINKHFEEGGK